MDFRINCLRLWLALFASHAVLTADCQRWPERSPEWARCAHHQGFELFERGEWEGAAANLETASKVWRHLGERFRPALGRSLDMLGETRAAQERWAEAEAAYKASVAAAGPSTLEGAAALSRLAYVLARMGRTDEAREVGHDTVSRLPSGSLERPMVMHVLAKVEPAQARTWLSRSVAEIIAYGKPHPALARILEDYADILIRDGNSSRAQPLLRRAQAMYPEGDSRRERIRGLLSALEEPDRQRHEVTFGLRSR